MEGSLVTNETNSMEGSLVTKQTQWRGSEMSGWGGGRNDHRFLIFFNFLWVHAILKEAEINA